jgi:proline iminopeptidase
MAFPPVEPFASGLLSVGNGTQIYWETSGNPDGQPVIWLHGGPGSGLGSGGYRRRLDPAKWLIIGIDQRASGRSTPGILDEGFDLATLTTQAMIDDLEMVREHLGVQQWIVSGGSWGTTLALAYAEAHPDRVTGLALAAVTTTSRQEVDWITESIGRVFPREWAAFAEASGARPGQRVVEAYFERLTDPGPDTRDAAAIAWCKWEDVHVSLDPRATPDPRYQDREFRNSFATHVVNSWAHSGFLGDRGVLDNIDTIAHLPVVLIHGRLDVSSPLSTAWELHEALPLSRLVVIESEGHGGSSMTDELERAYEHLLVWPSST